ncbi:glycerol channel [Diaporthe eres]
MARNRLKNRLAKTGSSSGLTKQPSTASARKRKTYDALEYTRNRMGLKPVIETRPGTHCDPELSWWPRMRLIFREPLLEFWGVLLTANIWDFRWSAAMIFGIYVAGDSGAYLNPAITLTNCLFRGLPLRRWPVYASAQLLGAFCGHGLVYANYISAIDQYEGRAIRTIPPSPTTSAKIFCQFPQPFVPIGSQIFAEFIANFFTIFLILAVRDENGADLKGGGFFVIAFFWLNFVVMAAFGWETGSPINPARDLMGRTWLAILGYKDAWSAYDYYFWIPVFVPFFACFFGALTYDIFIYTGDSPINNGAWSFSNLRKGAMGMWDNTLVKFGRAPRRHQLDEESQGARQGQDVPISTSNAEKEGRKSSSSSLQDNDPRRSGKDERDGANQGNENTGSESRQNIKNIRKDGYHGEAWEQTERTPESRQGQESESHRKDHDDKDQETQQCSDDTETQRKGHDQELEHKKDKETGYDDPARGAEENDTGEKTDDNGNGK